MRRVISTYVYDPSHLNKKSAKIITKIDEALIQRQSLNSYGDLELLCP
jgi:hypothetical protein